MTTRIMAIMAVVTRRLTANAGSFMAHPAISTAAPSVEPEVALDDDAVAFVQTAQDLDHCRVPQPERHLAPDRLAALDDENVLVVHDRPERHGQDVLPDADLEQDGPERPGPEARVRDLPR